jgi:hypothetical protein
MRGSRRRNSQAPIACASGPIQTFRQVPRHDRGGVPPASGSSYAARSDVAALPGTRQVCAARLLAALQRNWGDDATGDETLNPLLHLFQVDRRIAARPWELHRQPEDGSFPPRHGDRSSCHARRPQATDGATPDHAARELAARRDEHRNVVAPRDFSTPSSACFDKQRGSAPAARPSHLGPPLGERVVDIDRGMLTQSRFPSRVRERRGFMSWSAPPLHQALGEGSAAV